MADRMWTVSIIFAILCGRCTQSQLHGGYMRAEPYLFFAGRCEEAMDFYKSALGAEVTFQMRVSESKDTVPPGALPAGWENKIMHANLRIGETSVMVSDGNNTAPKFQGFSISLTVKDP